MKLLMLFVDGFEDTEAIATLDVLSRGKDDVDCVSLMNKKEITPKLGRVITVDALSNEVDYKKYDGVVIPGGPGSFKIMPYLPLVEEIIRYFADNNKLVASICAAPHLVGKLGYFKLRNYTVHPGFEKEIDGGNYLREKGVVVDGNFITAKSMWYSLDFGVEIHRYFHGDYSAELLKKSCQGEN